MIGQFFVVMIYQICTVGFLMRVVDITTGKLSDRRFVVYEHIFCLRLSRKTISLKYLNPLRHVLLVQWFLTFPTPETLFPKISAWGPFACGYVISQRAQYRNGGGNCYLCI